MIDFWKPQPLIGGMNLIQWSCLAGILFLVLDFVFGGKEHMSERLVDRIPFAKIFIVLAIVAGVSLGLCAVTFSITSGGNTGGGFWIYLGVIAFWVSIAGLLVTLMVFVTLSIFGAFRKEESQSIIFPKAEDDTKNDKNE